MSLRSKIKSKKENPEIVLLKNQLARALADYDNLRKRVEAEKENWDKIAVSKVILKLLPLVDMLINAQEHLQDSGLQVILGEFKKSLFELGAEEIPVKAGDEFNPLQQEAVETVQGGKKHRVAEIVQSGWKVKDESFVIRPVKVKVYGEKISGQKKEELEKEMARGDYM